MHYRCEEKTCGCGKIFRKKSELKVHLKPLTLGDGVIEDYKTWLDGLKPSYKAEKRGRKKIKVELPPSQSPAEDDVVVRFPEVQSRKSMIVVRGQSEVIHRDDVLKLIYEVCPKASPRRLKFLLNLSNTKCQPISELHIDHMQEISEMWKQLTSELGVETLSFHDIQHYVTHQTDVSNEELLEMFLLSDSDADCRLTFTEFVDFLKHVFPPYNNQHSASRKGIPQSDTRPARSKYSNLLTKCNFIVHHPCTKKYKREKEAVSFPPI